jgi:Protein of unknown function (DUF3631)
MAFRTNGPGGQGSAGQGLFAGEHARLDSYMLAIAGEARGAAISDSSGGWRFGGKGALRVFSSGQYHDFSGGTGEHGRNALQLIAHLYPNENAIAWARDWLNRHPGDGSFTPGEDDGEPAEDFAEVEAMAFTDALYAGAALIDDTPGYTYIVQTRGLPLRVEDQAQLRWVANYRGDEGALLAPITDGDAKLVKLHVTFVTRHSRKSPHKPDRIIIRGAKRPGILRFGTLGSHAVEVEGLEKGLAARASGAEYVVVTGGVFNFGKAPLPAVTQSVVIARDDDLAGSSPDQALWRGAVLRLGQGLKTAVTVRPNDIAPRDAPPLKDIDDLYRHDAELAHVLLKGANLEHGRLGETVDGAILDTASRLDAIALGRARKGVAQLLGISLGALDDELTRRVKARLEAHKGGEGMSGDGRPGKPLVFAEIEPWADPVDGAALLAELSKTIGAYVVMEPHQRDACALWFVFAHAHDFRDYAPLLIIKSAIKRSGKSRLAEIAPLLTPRPLALAGTTAAFIERAIEGHRPTLIVDEADRLRKGNPALAEQIDAQLNRSFMRSGAHVGKNVPLPGGGYEPRLFSTWAPTLIAGIGAQADTAEDRAVIIVLKRKLSSEKVKQLRARDGKDLAVLARKIARFVSDNEEYLRTHIPAALEVDNDRAKDVWEPLLTIAEAAGGEWPDLARNAGRILAGETVEEEEEFGVQILGDIRRLFREAFPAGDKAHKEEPGTAEQKQNGSYGPRLASADIVQKLLLLGDRPYGALGHMQRPLTQHGLARALKEFKVRPGTIRLAGGATSKGYYLRALEDAFARYLPEPAASSFSYPHTDPNLNRHTGTGAEKPEVNGDFASVTDKACDGSENIENLSNSLACDGVTVQKQWIEGEKEESAKENGLGDLPRGPSGRKRP